MSKQRQQQNYNMQAVMTLLLQRERELMAHLLTEVEVLKLSFCISEMMHF